MHTVRLAGVANPKPDHTTRELSHPIAPYLEEGQQRLLLLQVWRPKHRLVQQLQGQHTLQTHTAYGNTGE